jgi:hypothetical protein
MGASVAWPFTAVAQEAGRTYRVGMLQPFPRGSPTAQRLLDGLQRRGFIEGQNLTIDYRDYGQHPDLIAEYASELVKARADVINAGGKLADANSTTDAKLHLLQDGARAQNVELSIHLITGGEEIAAAIDMAQASGATALNVMASPMRCHKRVCSLFAK